jgi:amino acid transporter
MELVRGIRRWDLVAVAINGIIGAGIFGLPARVFDLIGAYSLLAFIACAVVVTLIILCFAEVGSRFSGTGGPYLYAREAFGPALGFQVGWLMWLARLTAFAANCNLLVGYTAYFWNDAGSGLIRAALIGFVVVALTLINVVGVRDAARVSNIFTIAKLLPLLLLISVGLFFVNPESFSFESQPPYSAFSTSVLLLVYAFTGFEMAVIPAGEISNPRRNVAIAILISIGLVAVIYVAIQVVCIGTLPELARSERPLADASRTFLGEAGGAIIAAGALVSIVGNLNVIILAASRLPFAMAAGNDLPPALSATHPRFRTPHVAILLTAAIMFVMTVSGTFIYAVTISTIARLLAYAATSAALIALRRRKDVEPATFKVPAGGAVAVLSLILGAWLLSNSSLREARDAAIAAGAGVVIYAVWRLYRKSRSTPAPGVAG